MNPGFVGISGDIKYVALLAASCQPNLHWLNQILTKSRDELHDVLLDNDDLGSLILS